MNTTTTKENICHNCGYKMNTATGVKHDNVPVPGDLSLCLNCGAISIFTDGLGIRKPTQEEKNRAYSKHPDILEAQIARSGIITEDLTKQ